MAKKNKFKGALDNAEIPYLIGETAYIHEGDLEYLLNLISEMIKNECCDGIKFHIMVDIDSYMTPDHELRSLLSKFLFSKDEWATIHIQSSQMAHCGLDVQFFMNHQSTHTSIFMKMA